MLLMIDNYDSFTYNLVQYFAELGETVEVYRNDRIDVAGIRARRPERLVVSPGPCSPDEAGISVAAIRELAGTLPILGVCLGHQALGQAFGGRIVRAERLMHGKTSPIHHDGKGIFTGLANPFDGMRYHSLIVDEQTLPDCLTITARTDEGELMAIRHTTLPVEGVQFHPESIMTPAGIRLLRNFMSPDYQRLVKG